MDAGTVSALALLVSTLLAAGGGSEQSGWSSTGRRDYNLRGKMFTLTRDNGSVTFYPPSLSSSWDSALPTTPLPTREYPATTYPSWTTAPPSNTGVSVCARYMADVGGASALIFTLSATSTPLEVTAADGGRFWLNFANESLDLRTDVTMWVPSGEPTWTSVCVSVDGAKNLVQGFRNSRMSVRKLLSSQYTWSGVPVIEFSGFNGQLTDVQVWDHPLLFRDVFNYMNFDYGAEGSVLRWSSIGFFLKGKGLLEDDFKVQARQPIRRGRWGGAKGGRGGRGGRRGRGGRDGRL